MWSQLNFTLTRGLRGTPGGIKTTSTHQQSTQSFIIIVFPGSDQTNRKTLTDKISGDLIFCTHFFVFSDRDFVKFLGIATQSPTVTKKSEQTLADSSRPLNRMMSLVPIVCQERLTGCPENILSSVIISKSLLQTSLSVWWLLLTDSVGWQWLC